MQIRDWLNTGLLIMVLLLVLILSSCMTSRPLTCLANQSEDFYQGKYDMAIWLRNFPIHEYATIFFIPTYLAVTDDTYRRYIIMKVNSPYVLAHEIMHGFVFSTAHSACLLDGSGFYPFTSGCIWLTKGNWEEAISNKWRDFNKRPEIPSEYRQDLINE